MCHDSFQLVVLKSSVASVQFHCHTLLYFALNSYLIVASIGKFSFHDLVNFCALLYLGSSVHSGLDKL